MVNLVSICQDIFNVVSFAGELLRRESAAFRAFISEQGGSAYGHCVPGRRCFLLAFSGLAGASVEVQVQMFCREIAPC